MGSSSQEIFQGIPRLCSYPFPLIPLFPALFHLFPVFLLDTQNSSFPTFPDVLLFPEKHIRGIFWDAFSLPHPIPVNLHDFPVPMNFLLLQHWHGIKSQSYLKSGMGIPTGNSTCAWSSLGWEIPEDFRGKFQRKIPEVVTAP